MSFDLNKYRIACTDVFGGVAARASAFPDLVGRGSDDVRATFDLVQKMFREVERRTAAGLPLPPEDALPKVSP